jgi:hypothetical protein
MKVSTQYIRNGVFVAKFQVLSWQLSAENVENQETTIYSYVPTWNLNNTHQECRSDILSTAKFGVKQ